MLTLKEIKKYAKEYLLEIIPEEWDYGVHKEYSSHDGKHCICMNCNRVWGANQFRRRLLEKIDNI